MATKKLVVLSLGGSLIIPPAGFDVEFLKGFKALIAEYVGLGYRFIIVCGGGQTARSYQNAAKAVVKELAPEDVDWIGIHATRLNAHLMRVVLREFAHPAVVRDFTNTVEWSESVLIASGWKPGCSTDFDAIKLAEQHGAHTILNLSNISYIYDADPRTNPKAKRLEHVSWHDLRKIVGDEWVPGANVPFDPIAAKLGEQLKFTVGFVKGTDLEQVRQAIQGKPFDGTIIE
jgi:uridylate kinase